ncbi:uncharacterized protein LOC126787957 [Argentina anserina]|uniref:uncharacterized protein LOC126787957 n=1 Tax=Argentina anserina TaxID=57926 RepID=UPI0021761F98|nr:uncharacterized protein LOC126787957 [Potentilla anserina]
MEAAIKRRNRLGGGRLTSEEKKRMWISSSVYGPGWEYKGGWLYVSKEPEPRYVQFSEPKRIKQTGTDGEEFTIIHTVPISWGSCSGKAEISKSPVLTTQAHSKPYRDLSSSGGTAKISECDWSNCLKDQDTYCSSYRGPGSSGSYSGKAKISKSPVLTMQAHSKPYRDLSSSDKPVTEATTLILIGEEMIHVVTDEKSSCRTHSDMILGGNSLKAFAISSNVLATIDGDPDTYVDMLTHASERVVQDTTIGRYGSNDVGDTTPYSARKCVIACQDYHSNMTTPETLIVGWFNGVPSAYEVRFDKPLVKHGLGDGFAHGSGGLYVQQYYVMEDPKSRSDEELALIAKRAAVYSALNNRYSSGRVRYVEVRPNSIHESVSADVLEVLHDNYDKFKTYLSSFIFCLYRVSDYEYATDNEVMLNQVIHLRFASAIRRSHVVQTKEKYYIRVLQFENGDVAKEEFQAVKLEWQQQRGYGHTADVDIHPRIRTLPWIEFHQLHSAAVTPLVFAMPTKKNVSLFLDL